MVKTISILAKFLLWLAGAFVMLCFIGIMIKAPNLWEGLKKIGVQLNPTYLPSLINWVITFLAFLPGIGLQYLAEKLREKE